MVFYSIPIQNSFCFHIEKPKFINYDNYPSEFFWKHSQSACKHNHAKLLDHNLKNFNACTDSRSWSMDDEQTRRHFQDIVCGRIPHCGDGDADPCKEENKLHESKKKPKEEERTEIKVNSEDDLEVIALCPSDVTLSSECSSEEILTKVGTQKEYVPSDIKESEKSVLASVVKSESGKPGTSTVYEPSAKSLKSDKTISQPSSSKSDKRKPQPSLKSDKTIPQPSLKSDKTIPQPSLKSDKTISQRSLKSDKTISQQSLKSDKTISQPSLKSKESEKAPVDSVDVVGLTDELLEKLDRNLRNLESTFDKFVKKNRDFIQNLVECLDFERQKQKALEDDYNKLKQENEALKTQNDYLKMVNNKQLDLFKNELDKEISESKVIYKRKIQVMERQLLHDESELQMYKQTEKTYKEVVEQDNEKIEKLNNKISDLKNREVQLVRNYLQLLKFLENVKDILSNADPREIPKLRSLNTVTDSEGENDPDVKRVLRNALNNGILALNVRDLSILHDAIEGINNSLCHQTDKCTKSQTADSSYPDFSNMSIQRLIIENSHEDLLKNLKGYDTSSKDSVDRIPIRQKDEDRRVRFDS